MAASLREGDKIFGLTQLVYQDASEPLHRLGGTILSVDQFGIRLDLGEGVIHFCPWPLVGVITITEEAPSPSIQER